MKKHIKLKQKTKNILMKSLPLLIIITIAIIAIPSLAEFTGNFNPNFKINVARWNIKVNGELGTSVTFNLADTIVENEYSMDYVVPGTIGKIDLEIDSEEVDVAYDYKILLDEETTLPENLKLYEDDEYNNEITTETTKTYTRKLTDENIKTHTIYWRWDFSLDDESEWMGKPIYVKFDIVATQKIGGDSQ